ncbi:hypothetical protein PAF17_10625, partial [Paracoccus sp. Z330]
MDVAQIIEENFTDIQRLADAERPQPNNFESWLMRRLADKLCCPKQRPVACGGGQTRLAVDVPCALCNSAILQTQPRLKFCPRDCICPITR